MTDDSTSVEATEVDRIERKTATRPWGFRDVTRREIDGIDAVANRVDSVLVPSDPGEEIEQAEVLFMIDRMVLGRRDTGVADVAQRVAEAIETDELLGTYIDFGELTTSAEYAHANDHRTHVRVEWTGGENE